jgi:phage terminase large subunit-like protein
MGVRVRFPADIQERIEALPAGQRLQAKRAMEQYLELRNGNPLLFFEPHPKQYELLKGIGAPLRSFFGGNRAGKTTIGIVDDLIQAAPRALLPEHLQDYKRFECPFYCRIMMPSEKLLGPIVLQKLREWTPKAMLRDGLFDASFEKANSTLRFECGCRFDFMFYTQDLDKFGGAALHRCHYDEEPPEDIRNECLMRLVDFNGDELFTMTPLQGMTWMFDGVWLARNSDPEVHVTVADMDDNPHLSQEAKERAFKSMSKEEIEARKQGRFVHFEGLVYPRFDETKVAAPDQRLVQDLEIVVGIDPGIREAGVVWIGFDRENNAIVFDELEAIDGETVHQQADRIRERNRAWQIEEKRVQYVIDPAARQRTLTTAVAVETEYANAGIYTAHGQNDREAGIAMIRARIDHGSLQVSEHCHDVFRQAARYRQQMREDGQYDVVKDNDHKMDAIRYGIMHRPWQGAAGRAKELVAGMTRADDETAFGPKDVGIGRPRRRSVVGLV